MEYVTPVNGDPNDPTRAYVDGDPSLGQVGSIPSARFFNLLLAEARNLVEGAGLALNPNDDAQWLAAVQAVVASGEFLTAPDLYQYGLGDNPNLDEDADGVTTAGWRIVGPATPNIPSVESGFLMTTHSDGGSPQAQIFIEGDAGSMWFRARRSSQLSATWFQWHRLVDDRELSVPGEVKTFAPSSPPPGWLKANGAAISRISYPELYAAIGTTYGTGDGATTFNLPDLRGEFIRGWDDGRGVDAGRGFG